MAEIIPLKSALDHDEAVKATFPLFIKHLRSATKNLNVCLNDHKWDVVAKIAHGLMGSAGSYGFPELVSVAEELEAEVKGERRLLVIGSYISNIQFLAKRIEINLH